MKTTNDIRKHFLDYFKKAGHEIVPSSPLIPRNDPTLMFTSAGMVQFKNVFTGQDKRPYSTASTAQKCLRAGGKHNDLENVGYTSRHHTFFEMLGNFSFGDYFKEGAIEHAWNLVHKEFGLPKDRLRVTVYHTDDEAFDLWKKIAGFSDDKITRIPTKDNFWSAGDTGPCGPCTEIFYDHGDHLYGGPPGTPEEDGDRFVEIWNLVFMQYDQITPSQREDLPNPSIDTGMGLERISAVLQGTHDNYRIDLFKNLIAASVNLTGQAEDGDHAVSHRVIADHLRAASFLVAEGVLPSNEGRGYVLRRIMRRGMRHAHLLGADDPLMHRLVPTLVSEMGDTYPELKEAQALITETLRLEEQRFKHTLEKGLSLLEAETAKLGEGEALSGDVAFKLYDTFGFPLDLTEDVLRREQNRKVDTEGFEAAMEKQREAARKSWKGSGEAATEELWFEIREQTGATEFLGYDCEEAEGRITALVDAKTGKRVDSAKTGDEVFVVVNQTPFYGESGGQVGDTGVIKTASGAEIAVSDTQKKLGAIFAHLGTVKTGSVKTGDSATLTIDAQRRRDIRANHSATHLLHAALRRHLGTHVAQKGSLVDHEKLRFDISQPVALTDEQIAVIEAEVNDRIRANSEVTTRLLPIDEAREAGAIAMFGEKYDDEVRVLAMGGTDPDHPSRPYSMELCGGTHVRRTGDIGLLKITAESAVSAGVRRIEAVTGRGAFAYLTQQAATLQQVAQNLKASPAEIPARVEALLSERKKLEREVSDMRQKLATIGDGGAANSGASATKTVNGIPFAARVLQDVPPKELKPMADALKKQLGSGVIALVAVNEGRASLVVGVTDDLTGKQDAVELVRIGAEAVGGKGGGGRPDMAQAGGPDGGKADDAINAIETALAG